MKKNRNIKGTGFILSLLAISLFSSAQTLTIYYAAHTDSITSKFAAGQYFSFNYTTSAGDSAVVLNGYRWVTLDATTAPTFRNMADPRLKQTYDSLQTGTVLRRKVDKIMRMSGGVVNVQIYLVDDRAGLAAVDPYLGGDRDTDGRYFIWPHASNWRTGANYAGYIALGSRACRKDIAQAGAFKNWEATILHELSHTQFLPDPVYGRNKWKSVAISYGGDAGHWFSELLADPQMALDEGLGTFWGLTHNTPHMGNNLTRFLNDTTTRFYLGSRSFLAAQANMWGARHNVIYSGPVSGIPGWIVLNTRITNNTGNYELRTFRWLDVPGEFVFYNEQMATSYYYLYWQYACQRADSAYNHIFRAARSMAQPNVHNRYPAYAANHLALTLEAYAATAAGQAEKTAGTLRSSMFAYALYDILTHFGISQQDFQRELRINKVNNQLPRAYTEYWNHRANLQTRVQPHMARNRINIARAVEEARNYFMQANTILQ